MVNSNHGIMVVLLIVCDTFSRTEVEHPLYFDCRPLAEKHIAEKYIL